MVLEGSGTKKTGRIVLLMLLMLTVFVSVGCSSKEKTYTLKDGTYEETDRTGAMISSFIIEGDRILYSADIVISYMPAFKLQKDGKRAISENQGDNLELEIDIKGEDRFILKKAQGYRPLVESIGKEYRLKTGNN